MLEIYYNCFDKYLDGRNFKLIQMDTDPLYIAILGTSINKIVRPELQEEYDNGGKAEFLTSKCYYAKNAKLWSKFTCKGISNKQSPMSWERYLEALKGSIDVATNMGSRIHLHRIVTYTQDMLGFSIYYDNSIIAPDGIHMEPLRWGSLKRFLEASSHPTTYYFKV